MTVDLAARFRRARIAYASAVFVDRRALAADPKMITCDGWLVPAQAPTDRVGGLLVYVDLTDAAAAFWHLYYCGEEHNRNRMKLGRGLIGWAISRERVEMIRRDVARWRAKTVQP